MQTERERKREREREMHGRVNIICCGPASNKTKLALQQADLPSLELPSRHSPVNKLQEKPKVRDIAQA